MLILIPQNFAGMQCNEKDIDNEARMNSIKINFMRCAEELLPGLIKLTSFTTAECDKRSFYINFLAWFRHGYIRINYYNSVGHVSCFYLEPHQHSGIGFGFCFMHRAASKA